MWGSVRAVHVVFSKCVEGIKKLNGGKREGESGSVI